MDATQGSAATSLRAADASITTAELSRPPDRQLLWVHRFEGADNGVSERKDRFSIRVNGIDVIPARNSRRL